MIFQNFDFIKHPTEMRFNYIDFPGVIWYGDDHLQEDLLSTPPRTTPSCLQTCSLG
jgi:hypothetical protein